MQHATPQKKEKKKNYRWTVKQNYKVTVKSNCTAMTLDKPIVSTKAKKQTTSHKIINITQVFGQAMQPQRPHTKAYTAVNYERLNKFPTRLKKVST